VKEAKGSVQALLQIKGTTDDPQLRGSLRVKNGDVVGAHYFRHVSNVQLAADFDGNDSLSASFAASPVRGNLSAAGTFCFPDSNRNPMTCI
jgi:autotransporter translocation and assembly factor TamB